MTRINNNDRRQQKQRPQAQPDSPSAYPAYDDFYEQETGRPRGKKRNRGCCSCSCAALIFIILLIIGGIAFKAFLDVQSSRGQMAVLSEQDQHPTQEAVEKSEQTSTALLMGIDSGMEGRDEQGRSDTMILTSAHSDTGQLNLASIPRDSYVDIPQHGQDKINHAYFYGGGELAKETASQFFNLPIDYYFAVDMQGLVDVINAMGGISLTPAMTFDIYGYHFQEGVEQDLDGEQALAYSRQRYDDPSGDYGRQARQRQVITATMQKVSSIDQLSSMPSLLLSLKNSVETNASLVDMLAAFTQYSTGLDQVNQYQIEGSGEMIDGVYYEVIPEAERKNVVNFLLSNESHKGD